MPSTTPSGIQALIGYLLEPPSLVTIVHPALLSVVLWALTPINVQVRQEVLQFLCGTSLSVTFSFWRGLNGTLSLHMLAGLLPLLVLLPRTSRPHCGQAYGLSFLSLLAADLWCSIQHDTAQFGDLRPEFYHGVGAAGCHDDLFILPIATSLTLFLLNVIE